MGFLINLIATFLFAVFVTVFVMIVHAYMGIAFVSGMVFVYVFCTRY